MTYILIFTLGVIVGYVCKRPPKVKCTHRWVYEGTRQARGENGGTLAEFVIYRCGRCNEYNKKVKYDPLGVLK